MEQTTNQIVHTNHHHRPLFITMICSFYLILWSASLISFVASIIMSIGQQTIKLTEVFNSIPLLLINARVSEVNTVTWLTAIGLVAGVVGYWLYHKWAVIVFSAASIALFIIALPSPASTALIFYVIVSTLIVNIALIALGVIHFKKMK